MKSSFLAVAIVLTSLFSNPIFSQTKNEPVSLGLPGDDLDLYAVMEVFQKSKTIEAFEKSLNEEKSKLNNLDLDKDKKVDFIKVVTNKDGDSFSFILQVAVSKTENQDVAVIFVSKDKSGKISMQIVGDEDLYGKDYVVEPKGSGSAGTANPGYNGGNTETMNIPAESATTTTVVVQSAPIVQYVYSPAYVPYYPPYYYGYYPPYYIPFVPIARAIFWSNNFHCHGGYYGGYHGSVNVNVNHINHYNNYNNNSRNRSNTVANNKANGNYGNRASSGNNMNRGNSASTRPSAGNNASSRPSAGNSASTRPSSGNKASTRPSNSASTRQSGSSASTRQSASNNYSRQSGSSASTRQSPSNHSRSSGGSSFSGGSRSSSGFSGGGRSGGGFSGGGGRGGRR
ncbi:hypothetical protein [Flavobacterium sp.]|uniref:hypothetical protein n=1 Tax=Flavobacterium sp. TaxID=239 RepID=UPI0025B9DE31|nr:hypothetical protein [Flavobacterium sp.]